MENKVVFITGASSGFGRDICLYLAAAGYRIVAAARRTDRLASLCDEINSRRNSNTEVQAVAVELDVSAKGSVIEAAVQKAWDAFGRIDALVNNAGIRGGVYQAVDLPEEEWENIFATNLTGLWLVSKYVCKKMCSANIKGSVINISSIVGLNRTKVEGTSAYAASKEGVDSLTKVMALELGKHNIRVNCISPGLFISEITESLLKQPWLQSYIKKVVPLQKIGERTDPELTSLVKYLIEDSSDYVSGNIFIVDSGATLAGVPIFSSL